MTHRLPAKWNMPGICLKHEHTFLEELELDDVIAILVCVTHVGCFQRCKDD